MFFRRQKIKAQFHRINKKRDENHFRKGIQRHTEIRNQNNGKTLCKVTIRQHMNQGCKLHHCKSYISAKHIAFVLNEIKSPCNYRKGTVQQQFKNPREGCKGNFSQKSKNANGSND